MKGTMRSAQQFALWPVDPSWMVEVKDYEADETWRFWAETELEALKLGSRMVSPGAEVLVYRARRRAA